MNRVRHFAAVVLFLVFLISLGAEFVAPASYETQFREVPNAAPSRQHFLGTDDLGRDRFSRLLYGTRVSLLLAPAAALISTLMAALIGGVAGYLGGWWRRLAMATTDLFLSLPWLFLLIMVRAALPLNVAPLASVVVTFFLLGVLGWAAAARVVCAGTTSMANSEFVLLARAQGVPEHRLILRHVLPNVKSVLAAQFWISIPVFILAEANLGILGLGVAEPLPSWGSLLRELEGLVSYGYSSQPWRLVPLGLLVIVVTAFQIVLWREEVCA